ncbi:hypothetical protein D3C73_972300 [compost metagenome]
MIGIPPFSEGSSKLTTACLLPATAITFVGAAGYVMGVALTSLEAALSPPGFVAFTTK